MENIGGANPGAAAYGIDSFEFVFEFVFVFVIKKYYLLSLSGGAKKFFYTPLFKWVDKDSL